MWTQRKFARAIPLDLENGHISASPGDWLTIGEVHSKEHIRSLKHPSNLTIKVQGSAINTIIQASTEQLYIRLQSVLRKLSPYQKTCISQ